MIRMFMLANWCLALALPLATTGCGATGKCLSRGQGGAFEECMQMNAPPTRAEKREAERRSAEQAAQDKRDEEARQRNYLAAKQPCAGGDAKACWAVAVHANLNNHPQAEILAALEVACDGKIAQACFELGMKRDDVARLATACELGHLRGCQMALAKDPSRGLELDTRACEHNDGLACERVAGTHAQRGDRAEIEKYLRLACRANREAACRQLGEMAAGER